MHSKSIRHRNGLSLSPTPHSQSPSSRKSKRMASPRASPTSSNPYSSAFSSSQPSRIVRTLCLCGMLSTTAVFLSLMPSSHHAAFGPILEPATVIQARPNLRFEQQNVPVVPANHRVVFLQGNDFILPISYPPIEVETTYHTVQDDWQSPHEDNQCVAKADWQIQSNPNCNSIHEISLHDTHLSVLGEGWFRTTWRYDDHNSTPVVLKTLRIARDYLAEYYELHRRDAVAMERLTGSPFVVNIYGYCGQSAINELADFPFGGIQNLEGFNKRMRGVDSDKANIIKLRMATSIALGLADIHAGGSQSQDDLEEGVYMAHYDLNPRNIALFAGGKPKINDFNIAEFIHYDKTTHQDCKFPSRLHEPWWRAPEEMNTTHTILVNEKVDVYALGNILYHTLTTHSSLGSQKKERMPEVRPIVAAGIKTPIPHFYAHSKDPNIVAIVKAIDLCWEKDPDKRASADEVASVLYDALVKTQSKVSLPEPPVTVENATSSTSQDDEMPSTEEDKDAVAHWNSP